MLVEDVDKSIGREELRSWLWRAADILRGAVRAEDYNDYMLPLLFFKLLSDEHLDKRQRAMEEYGKEFADARATSAQPYLWFTGVRARLMVLSVWDF